MPTSLYMPDVQVEIAFNAGYSTPAASRTWTDVSSYVELTEQINIRFGRGDELSTAEANSCTLALDNSDGRFTAGLSTGAYYPNVKIGRPIRVTGTPVGGSASVRYLGYIEEWPVEWAEGTDSYAVARITATSRMARLGLSAELKSIVEEEILIDDPFFYYPLGEASGATTISDTSGNNAPALAQAGSGTAVLFGNATGPGTDSLTGATFASGKYLEQSGVYLDTPPFTLEGFFSRTGAPATAEALASLDTVPPATSSGDATVVILINTSGQIEARSWLGDLITSANSYADGGVHHVALTATPATGPGSTWTLYVDGTSVGTTGPPAGAVVGASIRQRITVGSAQTRATLSGSMSHVALHGSALSATRVTAHANAGRTGFANETPAARLTRYASFAGVPTAETSFETGQVPNLDHIDTTGVTALEMMRKVEATEEGVLFDAQDGTLTFHDRAHRYSAASSFTLDASAGQVEASYAPKLDRSALLNDVTATTTDARITQRAIAQTSIDTYGVARSSIEVATTNAEEPFQHASWLVGQYDEPTARAPQLGVEIAHLSTSLQASILAATVGTRFTVSGLPSQSDAASKQFVVEGYTETIGPETYRLEFNVSPAEVQNVWTVEDPVYGAIDEYPIAL